MAGVGWWWRVEKGVAAVGGEKWAERLRFMQVVAIAGDGAEGMGN